MRRPSPQPLAQGTIVGPPRTIPVAAHVHSDQPAGPALAQPADLSNMVHRPTLHREPQNFPEALSFSAAFVQHPLRQQLLQLAVLLFQRPQLPGDDGMTHALSTYSMSGINRICAGKMPM